MMTFAFQTRAPRHVPSDDEFAECCSTDAGEWYRNSSSPTKKYSDDKFLERFVFALNQRPQI
jgi:hypothetical protein